MLVSVLEGWKPSFRTGCWSSVLLSFLGVEETDLAREEWAEQDNPGMCEAAASDRVDLVED